MSKILKLKTHTHYYTFTHSRRNNILFYVGGDYKIRKFLRFILGRIGSVPRKIRIKNIISRSRGDGTAHRDVLYTFCYLEENGCWNAPRDFALYALGLSWFCFYSLISITDD